MINKETERILIKTKNRHHFPNSYIINHFSIYNLKDSKFDDFLSKEIFMSSPKSKFFLYEHFFSWFRDYLKLFLKCQNFFINEDSFLPKTWKIYIALMTVSYLKCEYLFRILEEEFLESAGEESWLVYGFDIISEKLKRISKFCSILLYQPWKLNKDKIEVRNMRNTMITKYLKLKIFFIYFFIKIKKPLFYYLQELTQKIDSKDMNSWNLNEIISASMIMIHFSKLSSICHSIKIDYTKNLKEEAIIHQSK